MPRGPLYDRNYWEPRVKASFERLQNPLSNSEAYQSDRKPYAKEVRSDIQKHENRKPTNHRRQVPGDKWISRILSRPIPEYAKSIQEILNRPWNIMEGCRDHGISTESINLLLDMKRWCITTGQHLTIGEAVWADKLRSMRPETSMGNPFEDTNENNIPWTIDRYYRWAQIYATKERYYNELGLSSDSSDLDMMFLGFHSLTMLTAMSIGVADNFYEILNEVVGGDPNVAWHGLGNPVIQVLYDNLPHDVASQWRYRFDVEIVGLLETDPSRESFDLLFTHICNARMWSTFETNQKVDIAKRLCKWVLGQQDRQDSLFKGPIMADIFSPDSILREVGYITE